MQLTEVTALFADLDTAELTLWVERGWVRPDPAGEAWDFHAIDVARVRLIHDLRRDMEVTEDAVGLVLPLLDQVYELRAQLRQIVDAVGHQPPEVRTAILGGPR